MPNERPQIERVLDAVGQFLSAEATGAAVLLVATVGALAWANAAGDSYEALWRTHLEIRLGSTQILALDLRHWVNDALMALFFFVVGLEIKREVASGELSSRRRALLPAFAALGGMIVPAAIYLLVNRGGDAARGWGIPMATDIAFAVGVLSLFARRVPRGLIVFLLALAIADDIGAILVIAAFYSHAVDLAAIAVALLALVGVVGLWRVPQHWSDPPLVVLMVVVWAATLASGVHATIAGVALGLLAPATPQTGKPSVAERLELTLHPWTTYLVVPLFALANAGITIVPASVGAALVAPAGLGVAAGLVLGKPAGILAASWLATRLRIAALPQGITWRPLAAAASVAGVGFTVSLFIAQLALTESDLQSAKVGIFTGSLLSAALGSILLWRTLPRRPAPAPS